MNTLRVATYSRVSTRRGDQKPEVQIRDLRRYCHARRFRIAHELVDRATGGSDSRPGLKRLLELCRAREVDAVIVVKLDRLFRSLKHLVNTLDELEALGIKFIATRDQVDLTTPAGRMFVQILGSLAEFERALIRERIMLGLDHARASGKKLGRPRGEDRSQEIHKLKRAGLSHRDVAEKLDVSMGAICRAMKGRGTAAPKRVFPTRRETRAGSARL